MAQENFTSRVIRGRRNAARYVGLGSTQTWILQKRGEFPLPLKLGQRATGWLITELDQFLDQRAAERDGAAK